MTVLDDTYNNIITRFALTPDRNKFRFMLCPDVQSFKELTGKSDEEYQEWMVGNVNIFIAEGIAVAMADQIMLDMSDVNNYPEAAKLTNEEYFYDNAGYMYSGVYVLHLIKKYGIEVFKRIYAGREPIDKYLYAGFEREAIESLLGSN